MRPRIEPVISAPSAGQRVMDAPSVRMICLGMCTLDMTWHVERFPPAGEKVHADEFREEGGGMAANAAVAAARLGARVELWSRAGDDPAGLRIREELAAEGVDVRGLRLIRGGHSSVSSVVVDRAGERSVVNFRGDQLDTDPSWLPLDDVQHAGAVLADPRWPEGAQALFTAARQAHVPTVFDADTADKCVFDLLLPLTDYAVFSAQGLVDYSGETADMPAALALVRGQGCAVAGVTRGAEGVSWLDETGLQEIPALRVDVLDTTGAGDAFHGALAYAAGARWPLRRAMSFAAAVAALKCTCPGGRTGLPTLSAACRLLQSIEEP